MSILSIIVLAIALGIDSFVALWVIGASSNYQCKKVFLRLSILIGLFHFGMPFIGSYFSLLFVDYFKDYASYISAFIFVTLGLKMIKESFQQEKSCITITVAKSIILSYALSIDALAAGFSLNLAPQDYSVFAISSIFAIAAFLMSYIGYYLGVKSSNFNTRASYIIGGIVLIILGVKNLL